MRSTFVNFLKLYLRIEKNEKAASRRSAMNEHAKDHDFVNPNTGIERNRKDPPFLPHAVAFVS